MPPQSRRAKPLPPEERRAALVVATLPLLRQHGVGVSTRQIADAACVAEGTIFRAFPDKQSLIHAAIDHAFDPLPLMQDLAGVDRELPLTDRLIAVATIMQRRLREIFSLIDVLRMAEHPKQHRERARDRAAENELISHTVAEILSPDADQLRFPPLEVVRILRLLLFSATHPMISDGASLDAEQITSLLLDGVRRRPDEPSGGSRDDSLTRPSGTGDSGSSPPRRRRTKAVPPTAADPSTAACTDNAVTEASAASAVKDT